MIELCSKRRMLAAVILLVCVSIIILLLENILTPDSGRRLPVVSGMHAAEGNISSASPAVEPCWQHQAFTVVEACRRCTAFEKASSIRPECAENSYIEVVHCEKAGRAVRGCDQVARLAEHRFWLLELAWLCTALLSGGVVIVRQHQLERGALRKIQRQLASQV